VVEAVGRDAVPVEDGVAGAWAVGDASGDGHVADGRPHWEPNAPMHIPGAPGMGMSM
jgi:hypothetical protein